MSGKVVAIHDGQDVILPGVPQEDVIKLLERYLDQARTGQVEGVVVVAQHSDNTTTASRSGFLSRAVVGLLVSEQISVLKVIGDN